MWVSPPVGRRQRTCICILALFMSFCAKAHAQTSTSQVLPSVPITEVVVEGNTVFGRAEILEHLRITPGSAMPLAPAELATELERFYHDQDYSEAKAAVSYDEAASRLLIRVDEGAIAEIQFEGIDERAAAQLRDQFDVRVGDVFNRRQVIRALNRILEATRGVYGPPVDLGKKGAKGDPIEVRVPDGRRVLVIHLEARSSRFRPVLGTESREDWFSPVDGFAPALGFNLAVFDRHRFNHTLVTGYISYKAAVDSVGYSVGLERPLFGSPKLYVGFETHDVTASDDFWRLSADEQSLVAVTFKNSFHDYYRRRGVQLTATLRQGERQEWLAAWRSEHQEQLVNETDFSVFRDDTPYRLNPAVQEGKLRALLLGYSWDSRGFDRESLPETYRRHQADSAFGSAGVESPGFRFEWRSEISPDDFGGQFDFSRHVGNARAYLKLSPHQYFNARLIGGIGEGTLPPQRQFGLGGIGSVHGYRFKEALGERMLLANLEYQVDLGSRNFRGVAFFDSGRVWHPVENTRDDWLNGIGLGVALGDVRVEFGWRLDDIPSSFQVLVRLKPTF